MNYAIRSVEYMSDEVRELLLSNNCTITSIVDIVTGFNETENLITITSDDYLESWDVEDFRYVPNVGLIGQFVQKKLSMTVKNGFDVSNLSNQIGFVSFIVNEAPKTEDGKTVLYRVGMFIFDEVNKDDVKDKTTITGVDFTKIFEQKFDTIVDKISFPISAYNLAKAIVENCKFNFHGVDLNPISFDTSYTFNNSSFMIEKNPFVSGETCRDVLKYIGQLAGSWVRIGHNDNLGNEYVLIDFRKYQNGLQLKNVLTNDNYYDLELNNETFGAVNKIVMGLKDVDGENVSITDSSTTNPNICEIALWDNPITYTEALRTKAINDLKFLFGFTYTPFTTNTTGYPWLQAYDKIKLVTMDNTEILTYPFNRTISYNGHIKTKIDTIGTTTTETKYTYESPVTRGLKQTQIMVDKANQKITSLVSTTEEIQDDINPIGTYKGVKHADLSGCIESELIWQNSYGDSQQLTRSGKNLFTKQGNATPKTDTTFWNSISHTTPESDGWCKVSVDNTSGTTTVFANQFTKRNTIDKLEVNKTYSILVEVRNLEMTRPSTSTTPAYLQLCETAKDSVWQGIQNYDLTIFKETNKVVFQKLTKTNFVSSLLDFRNFVSVPKGYKVEFEYRLMVVKGSYTLDTIGEYEPYGVMPSPDYPSPIESITEISVEVSGINSQSNSLTIDLQGNELCSLPNGTKDEVNITNGEALLIKKIRHITRAIADMNNSDAYPGWTNETQLKEDYPNKNDSFLIAGINIRSNITNDAKYIGLNTNASGTLMLFKNLFNNMTQTEIKANYPDLVLDLYYELAEPETINLGNVNLPTLYNDINHVDFTTYSDFYYSRDIPFNNIYVSKNDNDREIRTITEALAKQEITNNSITNSIQETNTTIARDYATKESVASDIQQTKNSLTIEFNEQIEDLQNKKVDTLKNQLVTIDVNGIEVSTNLSTVSTIMRNDRFAIKSGNTEAFYVGYDENLKKSVSRMNDLTITDYFTAGYHRQEKFEIDGEQRTGWFYVGGE